MIGRKFSFGAPCLYQPYRDILIIKLIERLETYKEYLDDPESRDDEASPEIEILDRFDRHPDPLDDNIPPTEHPPFEDEDEEDEDGNGED